MSIASVTERIGLLRGLTQPLPTPAPTGTQSTGFAAHLTSAQGAAAPAAASTPAAGGATAYDDLITASATRNGVDPALLKGLIRQESNFDPNAGSPAGARGLAQLMPSTAASLGVGDPTNPAAAIEGGARYLREQLDSFGGSVPLALAAYNAGPAAVTRAGGVPPFAETRHYVQQVQAYADTYRAAGMGGATAPVGAYPGSPGVLPGSPGVLPGSPGILPTGSPA